MKIYYSSQYKDIKDENWKSRACSVVCLWMALKSFKEDFNLTEDELLEEGLNINGYLESGFWKHTSIALLAHNHGLPAYTEEFKSAPFGKKTKYSEEIESYGLDKVFNFLKNKEGAVIVSIPKNWTELDKPHSVLLHNVLEENGEKYFIYNDTAGKDEAEGENLKISLKDFSKSWRKLAIFINKGFN